MDTKLASRRKYPRYVVRTKTEGRLEGVNEVILVDISLGGVKIEHAQNIRPGTIAPLDFLFQGKKMRVLCRVVWSLVIRQEYELGGEAAMIYHSGLEFYNPSEPTRQMINDYLRAMLDEGIATPPDDGLVRRGYRCQACGELYQLADTEVRPVFVDPRKRPVQAGDVFYFAHENCDGAMECIFSGPRVPWTGEGEV